MCTKNRIEAFHEPATNVAIVEILFQQLWLQIGPYEAMRVATAAPLRLTNSTKTERHTKNTLPSHRKNRRLSFP
jgi:hypothetical protein